LGGKQGEKERKHREVGYGRIISRDFLVCHISKFAFLLKTGLGDRARRSNEHF